MFWGRRCPLRVKLRNTQHEQMSSALSPRADVDLARGARENRYNWSQRTAFKIVDNSIRNWTSSDRHRPFKSRRSGKGDRAKRVLHSFASFARGTDLAPASGGWASDVSEAFSMCR